MAVQWNGCDQFTNQRQKTIRDLSQFCQIGES